MHVPRRHVLKQVPVITGMVRSAAQALRTRPTAAPPTPGPEITATVAPRSPELVRDYLRHVGGNPSAYGRTLPPHLYPQWGFPLLARTLDNIPYDLTKVLNGGSRMEWRAPIPLGKRLHLRARLENIDDNGRRAVLQQRLVTGTDEEPEALICTMYAIVPLKRGSGGKKERPRVEPELREIDRWRLGKKAGLEFAVLTGDFNPVHWLRPYAQAAGFRSTILHGFATQARAIESMNRNVRSGGVRWWRELDVRFVRPLTLPARTRVFHGLTDGEGSFTVGDAPGSPAYLCGTYQTNHG